MYRIQSLARLSAAEMTALFAQQPADGPRDKRRYVSGGVAWASMPATATGAHQRADFIRKYLAALTDGVDAMADRLARPEARYQYL